MNSYSDNSTETIMITLIMILINIATSIHIGIQSSRNKRIGNTFWHVGMNLLVGWFLVYPLWLFVWPGQLRQYLFGNDRDKAQKWARKLIEKNKRIKRS